LVNAAGQSLTAVRRVVFGPWDTRLRNERAGQAAHSMACGAQRHVADDRGPAALSKECQEAPMRTFAKTLLAVGLACAATPALAQKAAAPVTPTTSDIRCMLAMGAIASNPESRQAATLGAFYFEGRINARAPTLNLPVAMKAEVARLDQATMQNEAKRCTALVNQASQTMQAVQAAFSKPVSVPAPAPK
jgi:hypothetical protein